MLGFLMQRLNWFTEGLAEAFIAVRERLSRRRLWRARLGPEGTELVDRNGKAAGRLEVGPDGLGPQPDSLVRQLARSRIDLEIPPAWVFRRSLPPVEATSAPYLDAFVSHQIERIAPWRAADALFNVRTKPLAGEATKLAIEVAVIPKRRVEAVIEALQRMAPARLRLVARGEDGIETFALDFGEASAARQARIGRAIARLLAVIVALYALAIGGLLYYGSTVDAEIAALDQRIGEGRAALERARRAAVAGDVTGRLAQLRASQPYVTQVLEDLSAALPDDTYLTELSIVKDKLHLVGVARRTPELVPTLEQTHHFSQATFSAPSTRLDDGTGDRFELDVQATGEAQVAP